MDFLDKHFKEIIVFIIIIICIVGFIYQKEDNKSKLKYLKEVIILCLGFLIGASV